MARQAKGCIADRDPRDRCRPRLLQQPGDPRLPRGRHHDNPAQAVDFGRQVGRTLRQAGLRLFAGGRCLSLSGRERLPYRYANEEADKMLRRYWTNACKNCSIKSQCTPGSERRITRREHEHLLDAVQQRLDANPLAMRLRRETVEHPFGTMKARMGATHFLTKTLPGPLGHGLQSDPGHQHRRDQAVDGRDRRLRPAKSWPLTNFPGMEFLHGQDPERPCFAITGGGLSTKL